MSSSLLDRSWSVWWSAGLALPSAWVWVVEAILEVASSAELCLSLPWMIHCFGCHICCLLVLLIFVDHWMPILPNAIYSPHPSYRNCATVGTGLGKFLHQRSFSVMVPVDGWLPWNLPAMLCIFAGSFIWTFDDPRSQAHQLTMSLTKFKMYLLTSNFILVYC